MAVWTAKDKEEFRGAHPCAILSNEQYIILYVDEF